jgi:hypothetical protein
MFKKFVCLLVLILLAVPLLAEESSVAPLDKKVGYALLDVISQTFHDMAMTGTTGRVEFVTQAIQKFMADARKAKEQNQIDAVFFVRYRRILAIIKLAVAPDPEGILVPIFDQELARFVQEVLGEEYKGSGPEAIGQVAKAIADEIINLHLYLDDTEAKAKLWKSFEERYSKKPEKK